MSPVTAPKSVSHTLLFSDVLGNAWQWCLDYFNPLNDFDVHAYYEGMVYLMMLFKHAF